MNIKSKASMGVTPFVKRVLIKNIKTEDNKAKNEMNPNESISHSEIFLYPERDFTAEINIINAVNNKIITDNVNSEKLITANIMQSIFNKMLNGYPS